VQVRTAFFTIYGDYIRNDDGMVTMSELTKLLNSLNFSEEAIKAAIYRMRHQQIVVSIKQDGKTYYTLTEEGIHKMEEGMRRTFRRPEEENWDGNWRVLIYSLPEDKRQLRDQLRNEITWLGFGQLTPGTWISPNDLFAQIRRIVKKYKIESYVQMFESKHLGPNSRESIINQVWDLNSINKRFREFIDEFEPRLQMFSSKWEDEKTFAERVRLVHEYRKFLHIDPGLPLNLLPNDWQGGEAGQLFRNFYQMLTPGAIRFYKDVRNATKTTASV
jgi:phenylacetic acid degradation operon negative regulatory protein